MPAAGRALCRSVRQAAAVPGFFGPLGALLLPVALCAAAISPEQLRERLESTAAPVVIDLRSPTEYQEAHIPGAINVPASVAGAKRLPPLGEVVLYDDGLGRVWAEDLLEVFQSKPGISPLVLRGGLAAWEGARLPSTRAGGLRAEQLPVITYDGVRRAGGRDAVLVDLRTGADDDGDPGPGLVPMAFAADSIEAATGERLESLADHFPGIPVVRGAVRPGGAEPAGIRGIMPADAAAPPNPDSMIILIDDGDGRAQEEARRLRAEGFARVVVLAGGETIIRRSGRPGMGRTEARTEVGSPPHSALEESQ